MNKSRRWRRVGLTTVVLTPVVLGGCAESPSVLRPINSDGARIERLWWVMVLVSSVVFAAVLFFLIGSVLRRNRLRDDDPDRPFGPRLVMWGGLVIPALILVGTFSLSAVDLQALASGSDEAALEIVVVGNQWWWRIEYPESGVVTANEIHVPTGVEIGFTLITDDVIHSFWVPQGGPKRDMIPGRANQLVLSFEEKGTYRGICSEFCGLQHAQMQFQVIAQDPESFSRWLGQQAEPAAEPAAEAVLRGRDVFLDSPCVGCHSISGVSEAGDRGPDLTHLASRQTIAGGVLEVNTPNLTAWIRDPSDMKPGVLMPPSDLSHEDLADLVTYLESLR